MIAEKIVSDTPCYSWRDLLGNKLKYGLHPGMLYLEGGYKVKMATRVKGMSKTGNQIFCEVVFDRDYVIEYIARIIVKLKPATFNDFQKLLSEAWKLSQELRKNE